MTTLRLTLTGQSASLHTYLAPGDAVPEEVHVHVVLVGLLRYRGHITALYWGINKKTGERHKRRTTQWWRFSEDNIDLFPDPDVRMLLRARRAET